MSTHRGTTVALVGADGAGKTTLARALQRSERVEVEYVYMGMNPAASTHMLPTTRLWYGLKRRRGLPTHDGGPPKIARKRRATPWYRKPLVATKEWGILGLRASEEWYRQFVAQRSKRKGRVVVFDRHFYWDYFAHEIAPAEGLSSARRLHGWMLARAYPKPEHIVVLDAPAEVLHARKGEGTLEELASRRQEYLDLAADTPEARVFDASRPLDELLAEIEDALVTWTGGAR